MQMPPAIRAVVAITSRQKPLYAMWAPLLLVIATASGVAPSGSIGQEPNERAAGEDIGKPPEDPTTAAVRRIHRQMLQAQELIAQRQTAKQTQSLQAAISQDLARLISDLEAATGAKGGAPAGTPNNGQQPSPEDGSGDSGKPDKEPDAGSSAGRDTPGNDKGARIWGHLPRRLRQRMRTAGVEEFLPKYEQMLEAYYQRLAERP